MLTITKDERELVYFAISNLIKDCYEFLEASKKAPPDAISGEELEFAVYILNRALALEDRFRKEMEGEFSTIQRPNWADLEAEE